MSGVSASSSELNILGTSVGSTEFEYLNGATSSIKTSSTPAVSAATSTSSLALPLAKLFTTAGGDDNYLFVVVDKSDGSIKVIDKEFIEGGYIHLIEHKRGQYGPFFIACLLSLT